MFPPLDLILLQPCVCVQPHFLRFLHPPLMNSKCSCGCLKTTCEFARCVLSPRGVTDTDGAPATGCNLLLLRKLQTLQRLDFFFYRHKTANQSFFFAMMASFNPPIFHFPSQGSFALIHLAEFKVQLSPQTFGSK